MIDNATTAIDQRDIADKMLAAQQFAFTAQSASLPSDHIFFILQNKDTSTCLSTFIEYIPLYSATVL